MNAIRTHATPMPKCRAMPLHTPVSQRLCGGASTACARAAMVREMTSYSYCAALRALRPGFYPVFREQSGCSPSVVAVVGRCNGIMSNPNANPYQPQPQPGPQKNKTSRRFFTWVRPVDWFARRPVDRRRMQRHRFTAWLEPHISTCVGDCMYIVLRFWRSSVRTRLVSDAGCTRWAHLGRGPHCRPMGLELSGMLPVPRRGNRDSRCGVGLYCARRLSAMAVGQKRHSPAGRVRIRGICAATGFTACVISSSTACLISSRATSTSISFVFSSATFSTTCFTTCFTNRA